MLVPVTTIGSLATNGGAMTNALQPCRSLDSGQSSSLTFSRSSLQESITSPDRRTETSSESVESEDDLPGPLCSTNDIQLAFMELLSVFDASVPNSLQHQRALNNLWGFYSAHADELEACASDLEFLLRNKSEPESVVQPPFLRVSTTPASLGRGQHSIKSERGSCHAADSVRWSFLHRRSNSFS